MILQNAIDPVGSNRMTARTAFSENKLGSINIHIET